MTNSCGKFSNALILLIILIIDIQKIKRRGQGKGSQGDRKRGERKVNGGEGEKVRKE